MPKKTSGATYALVGLVAVAVLVYVGVTMGFVKTPAQAAGGVTIVSGPQVAGEPIPSAITKTCEGITTISLSAAARNPLNPSPEYHAAALRTVGKEGQVGIVGKGDLPGGTITATATGTAGVTLSYATVSIPCNLENFDGEIYATPTALLSSGKAVYKIEGTGGQIVLLQPNTTAMNFTFRNNALSNTSDIVRTATESTASAMNAGDSRTGYLDLEIAGNTTYGQYGASGLGILWTLDTVTSSVFSDKALSITTSDIVLTEVDCLQYPKTAAVRSANRCWLTDPITTSSGMIRLRWTLTADGGTDPGASDDPVLYLNDIHFIEDQDSMIRIGTHNSAGTDQGAPVVQATWNNS